jgi:hypothetical protein
LKQKQQKSWETPQLIILAKAHPEENVLLQCKAIGALIAIVPYAVGQQGCDKAEGDGNCGACIGRGGKDS